MLALEILLLPTFDRHFRSGLPEDGSRAGPTRSVRWLSLRSAAVQSATMVAWSSVPKPWMWFFRASSQPRVPVPNPRLEVGQRPDDLQAMLEAWDDRGRRAAPEFETV